MAARQHRRARRGRLLWRLIAISALYGALAGLAAPGALAAAGGTDVSGVPQVQEPGAGPLTVRQVAERIRPAVVQIVSQLGTGSLDLLTGASIPDTGIGSGVVIDSAGHILTNQHVVAGARTLTVALPDGRTFDGRVVGADPDTDVAVVQINGTNLPWAPLGDSSQLAVGDWVVAIGNALGLPGGPTVTAGVVGALGRTVEEPPDPSGLPGPRLYDLIQTDAAINPGNSGGPLVNLNGEVVGINTLVAGTDEQGNPIQGIGFAIAINAVKPIAQELTATGRVVHASLGIAYAWAGPADAQQMVGVATPGALVLRVQPGSPAAQVGLQRGDLITQVDGQPLQDESTLPRQLETHHPGDLLQLTVVRNRVPSTVAVTLAARPSS
ncbi:MAG TPA: trypsin-like peptidase domain-containing protein [Chloroflexota bacterium]|nr:trypsin-like peptidase domain-containing protein [Chloroflexota bacterium]